MKLGGFFRGARLWVAVAVAAVLILGGTAAAVTLTVSAQNAAAEQAAAEAAAAAKARAERAAAERAVAIQEQAADTLTEGEALYVDSAVWGNQEARAELRTALDTLVTLQDDEDAVDELELATTEVKKTIVRVGTPPSPITLYCGNPDAGIPFEVRTLPIAPDGTGDFAELWAGQYRCDDQMASSPVRATARVQTALQSGAVAAGRAAGKGEYFDSDEEILYAIYEACAMTGSGAYYANLQTLSPAQAQDTQVTLSLCPNHPDAETWRSKSAAGEAVRQAEASGARVPPGGTYAVPDQMTRGTFVAENVTDCYWETRDANGDIVDNNFVLAAPRVVAEVTDAAVVFTTQGACGYWNRQ